MYRGIERVESKLFASISVRKENSILWRDGLNFLVLPPSQCVVSQLRCLFKWNDINSAICIFCWQNHGDDLFSPSLVYPSFKLQKICCNIYPSPFIASYAVLTPPLRTTVYIFYFKVQFPFKLFSNETLRKNLIKTRKALMAPRSQL